MRSLLLIFCLVVSVGVITACGGGGGAPATSPPVATASKLSTSVSEVALRPSEQTTTIDVTNAGGGSLNWTATLPASDTWLKISGNAAGLNRGTLSIVAYKNTGAPRSALLTVKGDNGEQKQVELSQSAAVTSSAGLSTIEGPAGWKMTVPVNELKPWNYQFASAPNSPIRLGSRSERFELRHGDCIGADCARADGVRDRAEVNQEGNAPSGADDTFNYEGDEYWYGWSFYIPEDYKDSGNAAGTSRVVTMGQFHQSPLTGDDYYPAFMFGKTYGGAFTLRSFPTHPTMPKQVLNLIEDADFRGHWHDIVVHAKWTTSAAGYFQVWVNGKQKVDFSGATRSAESRFAWFKYGLYRPADAASPTTAVVYYDELRRGKTRAQVDVREREKLVP